MRILVLFGNIPLLGKERGNIQALKVLWEQGADVLFATNKEWGHESIQPMLDKIGMAWAPMTVAHPLRRAMTATDVLRVVRDVVVGWWELFRIIRRYRPTHLHVPNEYQSLYNLPVLLLARVPIVYRLGDAPVQTPVFLKELWRHLVMPRVSRFVCVSEYICGLLLDADAPPDKITVIYNYPPERPHDLSAALIASEPFKGRTVLYVGQLSEDKGVDLLVEAAIALCRERDDVRFLLAGDYTWQNPFAEALMQRVEALGLSERIRFLGYVGDVPGLLRAADLHVCPSVWEEPLSNVVPEAKQAGVPSVVFASGGLPELIAHGEDGWICEAKTAASLQAGIARFLAMPEAELQAVGAAARGSMARLGITAEAFADQWMEVYTHV